MMYSVIVPNLVLLLWTLFNMHLRNTNPSYIFWLWAHTHVSFAYLHTWQQGLRQWYDQDMAMAIPVFEKQWRHLNSSLLVHYRMASLSSLLYLMRSKSSSSDFFISSLQGSKVGMRELRLLNFSIFCGNTWGWRELTNRGGANMCVVHGGYFW